MSFSDDYESLSDENYACPEEKSNTFEDDLPLEKLLKLSKSFKNGVDKNLYLFKEEKTSMLNEISKMNFTVTTPMVNEEKYKETITNNSTKMPTLKQQEDPNELRSKEGDNTSYTLDLEQSLKDFNNSLIAQPPNKIQQEKEETSFARNQINELEQDMSSTNQFINDNSIYLKKIFELEIKCQQWMNKYDMMHDKYLQMESKCVNIEKDNCSYQLEVARIKIIEEENLRINQIIDKSNYVRKELESALETCHEVIHKHQIEVEDARKKVKESLQIVEKICLEKEKLLTDLNKSNGEVVRLENELKKIILEAGKKVNLEIEQVKTMYKDKLYKTNAEIEVLRKENQIANNKVQMISKKYESLNNEFTSIKKNYTNEPDVNAKKMALLVQQIKDYEVEFNNLSSNIDILKETNTKLQENVNSHVNEKTKYMMDISFLKDTIKSLENNLNQSKIKMDNDNEIIGSATDTIKTLKMKISEIKKSENDFEQKLMEINELKEHIETQSKLFGMWRNEMHDMIEKFNKKYNEIKQRYRTIHKKYVNLKRRIKNSKSGKIAFNRHQGHYNDDYSSLSTLTSTLI